MRKLFVVSIIIALGFSVFAADLKLKDVPADHWAAEAVYDLVKMGVTNGYPDGTFRGNKPVTRFETAIFLSKLADSLKKEGLDGQLESIRGDLAQLKKSASEEIVLHGRYEGDWKVANLLANRGKTLAALGYYRLIFSGKKEYAPGADIKINMDTMDYGYFDDGSASLEGRGLLATELLDIESNLSLDFPGSFLQSPLNLKFTYGSGPKQHRADPTGSFPSEVGVTYVRPYPGIQAQSRLLNLDVMGRYVSVQGTIFEVDGKVYTGWLSGAVGYTFDNFLGLNSLKVDLGGDYFSNGAFSLVDRNVKAKVGVFVPFGSKIEAAGTVGIAKTSEKMMVSGQLSLKDPWDTGTVVTVKAAKVGSRYIDDNFAAQEFMLAGLDSFDRPLINGIVNIGGELTQTVADNARLVGKGEVRLNNNYGYSGSKARLTVQGGVEYDVAPGVNVDASYRVNQDKGAGETTDLAAVGLIYRF